MGTCGGSGIDPSALCPSCLGTGTIPTMGEVSVQIPAGCMQGSQLRVRGEGDRGIRGGPPGDLYITVNIEPSDVFRRSGFDILYECRIPICDAMLGTDIMVPTIDGDASIHV